MPPTGNPSGPRLAELLAALSLAIDLGLGQPMENFQRTCLLAVRLGQTCGLGTAALSTIYYLGLIQHLGCTAHADDAAAIFGDDLAANAWLMPLDQGNPVEVMRALVQNVGAGQAGARRVRMVLHAMTTMPRKVTEVFTARCEVAQRLAERLGLDSAVQAALGQMYERWDGRGLPHHLKGESVALPVRVAQVAQDAEIYRRMGGVAAAQAVIRERAGHLYDPAIANQFCTHAAALLADPATGSLWDEVLAAEPSPHATLPGTALDGALRAVADFVDLKSPYTLGHSSGVADLAADAGQASGLPPVEVTTLRQAGWLHDLGRIGVSNAIWDKPATLTDSEWERVRLHPYYTDRILARARSLGSLTAIATLHHERLDGSGYHRGLASGGLLLPARLLAAADVYHALTEPRPHRPARSAEEAIREVRDQVRAGRLDGEAVQAVLAAAGHSTRARRREWVAGLSGREVEVLRLVARGLAERQIATQLSVAERTVHHHVEHIYSKIGVSTRAAAALFAMQHNLLDPDALDA